MNKYERMFIEALNNGEVSLKKFAEERGIDVNGLYSILEDLKAKGLVKVEEKVTKRVEISEEGKEYLEKGFPEIRVVMKGREGKGVGDLTPDEKRIGLGWAKRKGLIEIKEGKIVPTERGIQALVRYDLAEKLRRGESDPELMRRGLIKIDEIKEIRVIPQRPIEIKEEEGIGELTKEIIVSGAWKDKQFKGYNTEVPGKMPPIGERHIINRFANRIRRIFVEMGFEEMEGELVESAFWNFDALFQPQDHPARELADTFYVKKPNRLPLPEEGLVKRVSEVHRDKWKYEWDPEEAQKVVLRTHTTTLSARKLAGLKENNGKFFSIGKVFRNEAIDYKHLAEFHQIEGIIVWDKANFRNLLWILKEFYRRLGFDQIMFKPSFFPYTEPSLEIHAYFKEKNAWIELGGAGIFRREVSIPLFGRYPVLAWGLSLERPLMMELELKDIRTFYKNDLREFDQISKRGVKWLL